MDKEIIKVKNQNGEVVNAEVVLAFEYNNKRFVIYTFNEEDENGMIILHASLLDDSKEDATFEKISPEDWSVVKDIMNDIVKEWKEQ